MKCKKEQQKNDTEYNDFLLYLEYSHIGGMMNYYSKYMKYKTKYLKLKIKK